MSHRHSPWTVRASVILYRRLLLLYPRAFRQHFAADMEQAFTDLARGAYQRDGTMGVLGVWGRALTDLAVTVLAERSAQMSSNTWKQLGGLCLMVGSSLGGLVFVIHRMVGFAVFLGVQGEVWLAVAAMLFIPGIIGLHLQLAAGGGGSRRGRHWMGAMGLLGTILAMVGVLLLALGQLAFALHLGGTLISCGRQCLNIEYSGSVLSERIYAQMQSFGTWGAVVGMGIVSVTTVLSRPFSWRAGLPAALVVGYVAFISLPSNAPAVFPGVELLLLWVVAAFLLGRDLWNDVALGTRSPLATAEAG